MEPSRDSVKDLTEISKRQCLALWNTQEGDSRIRKMPGIVV